MTLVLAMVCSDGLILAADSAATFAEGLKQPTVKIHNFGKSMLWGGSGHEGMLQEIETALTTKWATNSYWKSPLDFRQQVRRLLSPIYQEWSTTQVPIRIQQYNLPSVAHLVFVGYIAGQPCIIEVEPNCTVGQLEGYGHHAIGSAALIAQALLYPHRQRKPLLEIGKVICYRVMEDAIEIAPGAVAKPIHLWVIEKPTSAQTDSKVYELGEGEDLEQVKYGLSAWRSGEEDLLARIGEPPKQQ